MVRLLYIGKSNKKFTKNRTYTYHGDITYVLTVYTKRGNKITLNYDYLGYFEKNFKFVDELEYKQLVRALKIKKISNG